MTLEPLIVAELQSALPELKTVGSVAIMAGATDISPFIPAAFVIAGGATYGEASPEGGPVVEVQTWEVVLYVEHYKDPADVDTSNAEAGPLLDKVLATLHGRKFDQQHQAMTVVERPAPVYYQGFGEYPILFETRRVVT